MKRVLIYHLFSQNLFPSDRGFSCSHESLQFTVKCCLYQCHEFVLRQNIGELYVSLIVYKETVNVSNYDLVLSPGIFSYRIAICDLKVENSRTACTL